MRPVRTYREHCLMDKVKEYFLGLWEEFGGWIVAIACVIGVIVLIVAGYSFWTTFLVVIVLALSIWRALSLLVQSIIFATLLKVAGAASKPLTALWLSEDANAKLHAFLNDTSWLMMTLIVFLALYAVAYALNRLTELIGSFQPVSYNHHVGDKIRHG